ncbi:MAG: fibronectin type III domain-containing protein, partial [Actinomycetota bacterium]|nr:fibronectin type III domain-containing protein [Actinomycetota bacterium]
MDRRPVRHIRPRGRASARRSLLTAVVAVLLALGTAGGASPPAGAQTLDGGEDPTNPGPVIELEDRRFTASNENVSARPGNFNQSPGGWPYWNHTAWYTHVPAETADTTLIVAPQTAWPATIEVWTADGTYVTRGFSPSPGQRMTIDVRLEAGVVYHLALGSSSTARGAATITMAEEPTAPTDVSVTAGVGRPTVVSWAAPADDGGTPVTTYTITCAPFDGLARTCATVSGNPAPTSVTVTGVINPMQHTFWVTATTLAGDSPPSEQVTPVPTPVTTTTMPTTTTTAPTTTAPTTTTMPTTTTTA